ncbi:TonB-dependent receptor [Sphingomonas histidinilytica]|nr:TonB-dependent receptor [Rhizorhabdus histidinilytica]QEH79204.1 TonB-dependent receptor [Sphingomonas sp. C8-2]
MFRSILLASVGFSCVATMPAQAQEASLQPGDIVVTARRQNERLLDVPASISVLAEQQIERTGVRVAADFVQLTPGVTIVAGNLEAADTQINIRGLNGARDAESNVALVVDGVLKTNTSSLNQDQGALQQIEVLKGPQGAYYGRNAAAGAIVITTKKPGDRLEGSIRASAANDQTYSVAALLSGPVSDTLGFVINGDFGRSDGFYRNALFGTAVGKAVYPSNTTDRATMDDYRRWNINGRLLWQPGSDTDVDLKLRYGKLKSGGILFNAAFQIPALSALNPDFDIDVNKHKFIFTPNIRPRNQQETFESSIRLSTDLGFARLNAYAAYNDIRNSFYGDGTSGTFAFFNNESTCQTTSTALAGFPVQSPFGIGGGAFLPPYSPTTCDGSQFQRRNQKDFSAEIRLVGEVDRLKWQLGGYYLHIDRDVCLNLGLDTGVGVVEKCYTTDARNPTEALAWDAFKTDVYAAFGSLDYKASDALSLALALRYDIESRDVTNRVPTAARTRWVGNVLTGFPNGTATTPANYYLNPGLDPAYNPSGVIAPRQATFKQLEPKVSLSYKLSQQATAYANWGVGFKSGGFNNGGSQVVVEQFFNRVFNAGVNINDTYRKERSSSFEAGFKWGAPGGRATFELAGYWTDVRDMQFFEFFVGPFGLLRVVSNIDKVRVKGIEAAASAKLGSYVTLFASGNVIDSKIRKNGARPYTVGNKSPYTADYTLNVGGQIDAPVTSSATATLRVDYRLTGPTWFHTVQTEDVPNVFGLTGNFRNSRRDAYGIVNIRGGVTISERLSVTGFATNLFNKKYPSEVIPAPEFGGDFLSAAPLRRYGLEVGYKF